MPQAHSNGALSAVLQTFVGKTYGKAQTDALAGFYEGFGMLRIVST
jgi:hypothetical protein